MDGRGVARARGESVLTAAIGELSAMDARSILARTERSTGGRGAELRPRLREAVRAAEIAPEEVLRRLDEDTLEALARHHGLEVPPRPKHRDLLTLLAAAVRDELSVEEPRHRKGRRGPAPNPARPGEGGELERLREEVDRLLDERARLEAKNASLRREVSRLQDENDEARDGPGLAGVPDDLSDLLRSIGVPDAAAFKRLYRPAVKLLHPDQNAEGEPAFRLLTRIRELLEGR